VLGDALVALGAQIRYCDKKGFLPIHIKGNDIHGGEISIDTSVSSQFVSAILLIGPYLEDGLKMNFVGDQVSKSYVKMTVDMMKTFGARVNLFDDCVVVDPHPYNEIHYEVEADWTSAAYWYELAALSKHADIFIPGLHEVSIQGDQVLPELYAHLGVRTIFEEGGIRLLSSGQVPKQFSYDFSSCSDLALSVITTCAALKIKGSFKGVKNLKFKESDRLESLKEELIKIGAILKHNDDTCSLSYSKDFVVDGLVFNTYHDHRLAMSFAPLVMKYPDIMILDPEVVAKSYPSFWREFEKLEVATLTDLKNE